MGSIHSSEHRPATGPDGDRARRQRLLCMHPCHALRRNGAAVLVTISTVLAVLGGTANAWAQSGLFTLSSMIGSRAFGVNGDGTVVVGSASDGGIGPARAFRWTQATGMVSLGTLDGGSSEARAVSRDGAVVVGTSNGNAFRWSQATGMVSLGALNGGDSSFASGANQDGSVIVGSASNGPGGLPHAFRWTQAAGMVSLGFLGGIGGALSQATAVSADGSVVVGTSGGALVRAFRWTQATGMMDIGSINGGQQTRALAVNADGSVIVGDGFDGPSGTSSKAFRWTSTTGIVSLGTLPGGRSSTALAVNADGSVVVGLSIPSQGSTQRGFRWTQASGMQTIEEWLRSNGVEVSHDEGVSIADGVDDSGNVVVGFIQGPRAFLARVSPNGSGMITEDFYGTLSDASPQTGAFDTVSLVLHGSHGNPLLGRVPPGAQSCLWASGDWGRNDHRSRDGPIGLAEFGGCRMLGANVQLSGSLGLSRSRQDLDFDGRSRLDGTFATIEVNAPLGHPALFGTLTGLYQWGDADVRRGYLNAGVPDSSKGSTDANSWAVRGRLDWQDALGAGGFGISPFADLTYMKTRVGAYTEKGGGFPVRFDARKEDVTELRLGANAMKPFGSVRLLSSLEAVHRFDGESARNTGQILGLFAFDVPGTKYEHNWWRAGIGVDGKLGPGNATVMLNATTKGEAPSYWIAASYRIAM